MRQVIPEAVQSIAKILNESGHAAYLVGGCVRDLLRGMAPKDWDIATDARPEEIQKLFPESVYENEFGTVGVKTESAEASLRVIEITTFRKDAAYTDKRHPDAITFADTINDDLARRDFTINAMAWNLATPNAASVVIDPCNGQSDLEAKIIRAVGDPNARFNEDALRLMRAVRFAAQLGFIIEEKTATAIKKHAGLLEMVSKERIRDEFSKLIMTDHAAEGVRKLEDLGLLRYVIPELREGIAMAQNLHHIYTVFEHNILALDYTVKKKYSFAIRLAALLHDVGKPRTKRGEGKYATFYNHEVVGARMTVKILDRLRFSKEIVEYVTHLVRWHLFYYNVGEVSAAGVRRFLARIGVETVDDILRIREADRIGSGVPKAFPYRLRHLKFMIEKVRRDPVHPKMLALRGDDVMKLLNIEPCPRIGHLLTILLEEVLDDPTKNNHDALAARLKELHALSDAELVALRKKSEARKEEFEAGVEAEMKKRHAVS